MATEEDRTPAGHEATYAPTAMPSLTARVVAFAAILVAGVCGGTIGYAFVHLQTDGSALLAGLGTFVGAVGSAAGVAVVATLALRAMGEWQVIQQEPTRQASRREQRRSAG